MLPKMEHPVFKYKLPVSNKVIQFRPMTVKEEKILLFSEEEQESRLDAIKQVLNNCLITELNLDKMSYIDFEALFIHLRAMSIDNKVPMSVEQDGKRYDVTVDLTKFTVKNIELFEKNKLVEVDKGFSICFRQPTLETFIEFANSTTQNMVNDMILPCIDVVYYNEGTHDASSFTKEELLEFFDSLPSKVLSGINNIFENLPYLSFDIPIVNEDGLLKNVEVRNLKDFF